jgi:hypothetical protein
MSEPRDRASWRRPSWLTCRTGRDPRRGPVGQPREDRAGQRGSSRMPVPSTPMTTPVVQIGARTPGAGEGEALLGQCLAVSWDDLLDAHPAEHIQDLSQASIG